MLMTESEKVRDAQDFIAREVQKKGAGRVDALNWEQAPHDQTTRIHLLVIFRGGEKSIFTFTEYELLEGYGSRETAIWR
jgi:hypothetical protein